MRHIEVEGKAIEEEELVSLKELNCIVLLEAVKFFLAANFHFHSLTLINLSLKLPALFP